MLEGIYKNTNAVFLAHGYVAKVLGKTINGVLMHSELFNIVALIDEQKVGIDTSKELPGVTKKVPVVSSLKDTLQYSPKVVILLENSIINSLSEIKEAINLGLDIINPGFKLLNDNEELVNLAKNVNSKLIDLRRPITEGRNPDGKILDINAKVVFVTGTDCGLGKRTAAYELVLEARKRGIKAGFAATGQTGIMLGCDGGVVFDILPIQYAPGAIEELIYNIDQKGFDLIFLEGQAAIRHFGGSAVLALLHAGNPHSIVMVHDEQRKQHAEYGDSPIYKMGTLQEEINLVEQQSLPGGNKFKVNAIATIGNDNIEALEELKVKGELQDLPIADARQENGPAILLDAVLEHLKIEYQFN